MAITVSAGCVILELGEGEHVKRNGSIRQQVQRLLFLCSVVSLLLLGGIALLGMMGARENSRQSGYEMGEEAALTVSTTLRKEAEERMHLLASERAAQIGLELQRIADRTELMRSEISWIMEHTGDYPLPSIFPPFPGCPDIDIRATMHAAKEVGGDFYDFYMLDEKHIVVTIAGKASSPIWMSSAILC